ncbi:MAG: hypothetical protein ACOZAO_00410 [Patescibacteria group bacterium]
MTLISKGFAAVVKKGQTSPVIKLALILFAVWVSLTNINENYWFIVFGSSSAGLLIAGLWNLKKTKEQKTEIDSVLSWLIALSILTQGVAMLVTGMAYKSTEHVLAGISLIIWVSLEIFNLKQ